MRLRSLARLRRFGRDEQAGVALEFALTVGPFIFLMLAIFEYALLYLASSTLDSATREAAREVRTGEAQAAAITPAQFKALICDDMGWLKAECPANLEVDARIFTSFTNATDPSPTTGGAFDPTKLKFALGGQGDIVMVTSFYKWKLLTSSLVSGLSSPMYGSGYRAVTARAVFRNEPFGI